MVVSVLEKAPPANMNGVNPSQPNEETDKHLMMVGWRTRLIQKGENTNVTRADDDDKGSLLDPSWWTQTWPEPDTSIIAGGSSGTAADLILPSDFVGY
jgi:hypothetical protein